MTTPLPPASSFDLDLALAFRAVLVRQASHGSPLTYGELVDQARAMYPDNASVQKALPMAVAKPLGFMRAFMQQQGWPDLSALAMKKSAAVGNAAETEALRQRICAFDWAPVAEPFEAAVAEARQQAPVSKAPATKKPMSYDKAAALMSAYYMENRQSLPASVKSSREVIIQLIREGRSAQDAFADVKR